MSRSARYVSLRLGTTSKKPGVRWVRLCIVHERERRVFQIANARGALALGDSPILGSLLLVARARLRFLVSPRIGKCSDRQDRGSAWDIISVCQYIQ